MPIYTTLYGPQDIVYLRLDRDQKERMVCEIKILPPTTFLYTLVCGSEYSTHYEFEITCERKPSNGRIGY